jgi:ribosomal protein S17E
MNDISENSSNYTEKDWKIADEKYARFTGELLEKYKSDFIWSDYLVIAKHEITYNISKPDSEVSELFNDLFKDSDKLKEKVMHYYENDMKKDLEELKKATEKFGESASKALDEILNELEKK